ncbi:adenylosuccinate synthetase [Constantimarinum furrinae]|nr:adenylosuccinate synthetase [Constantimarinum furrinae]
MYHPFGLTYGFQIPKEVPHPDNNSPIDLTNTADIIIYIAIPIAVLILYFIWRRKLMKSKK